jgi:hypothetical protein
MVLTHLSREGKVLGAEQLNNHNDRIGELIILFTKTNCQQT